MTDQEIARVKTNLKEILNLQISAQREKLNILKSYQLQLENATSPEELKRIHDDLAVMFGLSK